MLKSLTDDIRIQTLKPLISPALLIDEIPLSHNAEQIVVNSRMEVEEIITGKNKRLLVIIGPCSIHDPSAALEYGMRLRDQIKKHQNELCIIMRVYFEKPRTIVGWKGLINDPDLNDSFNINGGLRISRKLLSDLVSNQVPAASEFLDTIIPQFISDLISWGAIGARTTESQVHRELASGLSVPVGFKNGTDGNISIAIDAIRSASYPHHFLSLTKAGAPAIVSTKGNNMCHIILRGGSKNTNFDEESIQNTVQQLQKNKISNLVMVDCSHGNSLKDHKNQRKVVHEVCRQVSSGSKNIMGVMIESHLFEGKQDLNSTSPLKYGQSITDACIGWGETVELLNDLANCVKKGRN